MILFYNKLQEKRSGKQYKTQGCGRTELSGGSLFGGRKKWKKMKRMKPAWPAGFQKIQGPRIGGSPFHPLTQAIGTWDRLLLLISCILLLDWFVTSY
jgi:hypothetical protein